MEGSRDGTAIGTGVFIGRIVDFCSIIFLHSGATILHTYISSPLLCFVDEFVWLMEIRESVVTGARDVAAICFCGVPCLLNLTWLGPDLSPSITENMINNSVHKAKPPKEKIDYVTENGQMSFVLLDVVRFWKNALLRVIWTAEEWPKEIALGFCALTVALTEPSYRKQAV